MKIKKIKIIKFRGFDNIEFELGTNLTAIAGQNGTQKTTLLGILTQAFTITDSNNPIKKEKPLTGGNFKSAFSEKFKLSDEKDTAGSHEWSLYMDDTDKPFTLTSIYRNKNSKEIRFWKKGTKSKGSGYLQLPVIFLSLNRLIPLGEDKNIDVQNINLTKEEIAFINKYHKKILLIQDDIKETNYLKSKIKNTIGVNTDSYDWKQNSAGQDNIGKILLAILSFQRLKDKYPDYYKGGILAIDELEATLYPAAQEKLVEFLSEFAGRLKLQIFFTTHSLDVLKKLDTKSNKNKIVFFQKKDNRFIPHDDYTYKDIEQILRVISTEESKSHRITVYCEDEEGRIFTKQLLGKKITQNLNFNSLNLGGQSYITLVKHKFDFFSFPNCLILLDGDVKNVPNKFKHIILLPGNKSPERLIADYLNSLSDSNSFWNSIGKHYTKQVCFKNYTYDEICEDREKAKNWFNEHKKQFWGRNASKVLNPWINKNKEIVEKFKDNFIKQFNLIADKVGINKITNKEN